MCWLAQLHLLPHHLNHLLLAQLFNVFTIVVKFFSCALAVASGLPVGPEGPLIHIGAALGAALSQTHSTTLGWGCCWCCWQIKRACPAHAPLLGEAGCCMNVSPAELSPAERGPRHRGLAWPQACWLQVRWLQGCEAGRPPMRLTSPPVPPFPARSFNFNVFKRFRNPKDKRDFVTAGVAVGVAAAFNAPIGELPAPAPHWRGKGAAQGLQLLFTADAARADARELLWALLRARPGAAAALKGPGPPLGSWQQVQPVRLLPDCPAPTYPPSHPTSSRRAAVRV
jgi:hypothetical protein